MRRFLDYVVPLCLICFATVSAISVAEKTIKSKGTVDGKTSHPNVNCKLEHDVRGLLWATVTLSGKLETGWVSVNVIKDGVTLYTGGDIKGLNYTKPSGRKVFMVRLASLFVCIALLWSRDAYAYLDPGTGSFLLQALIATIFGALFTMKYWFRTVKYHVLRVFGKAPSEKPSRPSA